MNLRLSGFVAVSAVLHLALLTLVLSIQPDSAVADTASVTLHVVEAAPYLSAIPRPDSAEVSKAVSEPKPPYDSIHDRRYLPELSAQS